MRIIISPAKKMNEDTDSLAWRDLPKFMEKTEVLHNVLKSMSYEELKKLWKCNDSIAQQNVQRLETYDLRRNLTPALLAYEGIQYQYMAPTVFTEREYAYVQEYLRILSGFYGVLRPFDGVIPYRLEMQSKLPVGQHKDLYAYWGETLAKSLFEETDCIINLASKEYSACISKYLSESISMITCVFGEERDGKVVEKGTMCKMARGEMVRWMAENGITDAEALKGFDRLHYRYADEYSDKNTYVFLLHKEN